VRLKRSDGYVYLRCRLDIPFPVLEVAPEPAPGHAVNVGPIRGRKVAAELVEQLNSLFGLRHCGRRLRLREHPSAYGQMGRCLSPCLGDLDPNLYRRRLDEALAPFSDPAADGAQLVELIERQMAEAAAARRYERAAALLRRRDRLERLVERLTGLLEATHARTRLVVARHPAKPTFDAFWIVSGRVADWGPLPAADEIAERTQAALRRRSPQGSGAAVPPDEVDEVRIVHAWLAAHDPPQLALHEPPERTRLEAWLAAATAA
jgi:DNA polymerase-3 subunit epsilon